MDWKRGFIELSENMKDNLGCKISDELKEILISISKTKEIECYQAKKSFFEYKLYFEKVC